MINSRRKGPRGETLIKGNIPRAITAKVANMQ